MTHLDEKALLPCPFCGKEPIVTRTVEDDNFDRWFHVRCEECAIEIGDEYRSDAINTWNRRASPALPSSPVSELVEALLEWSKPDTGSHDAGVQLVCEQAATTLTSLSTRNAELEREVKRLREVTPREPTGEMMDAVRHIVQWLQEPTRPTEAGLFARCSVMRKPLPEGCREGIDHVPPARLIAYWIWTAMHDDALSTSHQGGEAHPDDLAVDRFAAAMKEKLAKKREEGRGGWWDDAYCNRNELSQMLRSHVEKGDPLDVGNFAMMLHQRGDTIVPLDGDEDGSMTPEEIRLENLKQMAAYSGPVVSFDVREPYYLASCNHCGWVGSTELCGTDSYGDDSDVYCPRCHASGADSGKVASRIATPPAPKVTEGEWREVQTTHLLKGYRRSPAYFPATGEVCEVSGPNCDNADGYTWGETTVLWQNEVFVLYGSEGFWPVLHKHEHVMFRPLTAAQEAGKP